MTAGEINKAADMWAAKYLAAVKRAEAAERERDALRSKIARQRNEIGRLTHAVATLHAEKAALRADLHAARGKAVLA